MDQIHRQGLGQQEHVDKNASTWCHVLFIPVLGRRVWAGTYFTLGPLVQAVHFSLRVHSVREWSSFSILMKQYKASTLDCIFVANSDSVLFDSGDGRFWLVTVSFLTLVMVGSGW